MTPMTAADVLDGIRADYLGELARQINRGDQLFGDQWSLLTELLVAVPGPDGRMVGGNARTLDALLVRNWSSGAGYRRIALEVKISRSDFARETDRKRGVAETIAHQCAYATPPGLLTKSDLPAGWGLLEVAPDNAPRCRWRVKAPLRTPTVPLDSLVSAIARQATRNAERLRLGDDPAADVAALRQQVRSLTGSRDRYRTTVGTMRDRLLAAAEMVASAGTIVCTYCRKPLRPRLNARWTWTEFWVHADPTAEPACAPLRREEFTNQWTNSRDAHTRPIEPAYAGAAAELLELAHSADPA